jgi:FkbM family methyltransferase
MRSIEDYINSPLPIQKVLLMLFDQNSKLTIFDIGACEAEDSIRYSNLFPESIVYAFEPLPANYQKCLLNIQKYKKQNIKIFNLALANQVGESNFYVSSGRPEGTENENWDYGNKSSSIFPPNIENQNHEWLKFEEQIVINTDKIYNFCSEHAIESIDFIHMDVQGAELEVLQGADDIIKNIKAIWLEVESIQLYEDQPIKEDIEKYMKSNGFVKLLDTVGKVSGDQLYIKRKYFSLLQPGIIKTKTKESLKGLYRRLCR